ncbi:MAG TPA: VOC family protein [Oculatellaceae cyanobacterium]
MLTMILGVEHLALSCTDVVHSSSVLNNEGYTTKFVENEIENHISKSGILNRYQPLHSIAYCRVPQGISLELTDHGSGLNDGESKYKVLLRKNPLESRIVESTRQHSQVLGLAFDCPPPRECHWEPFGTNVWFQGEADDSSSNSVAGLFLPVKNLEAAKKFWLEGLACQPVNEGELEDLKWLRVAIAAPFPAWSLNIVLVQTDDAKHAGSLDDVGFPCLALISNRIVEDMDRALFAGGHEAIEPFTMEINGQHLKVCLLRGPDDELIELIEVKRTNANEKKNC